MKTKALHLTNDPCKTHKGYWSSSNTLIKVLISLFLVFIIGKASSQCNVSFTKTEAANGHVTFVANITPTGGSPNITWYFGDGGTDFSGSTTTSHTYASNGNYSVSAYLYDSITFCQAFAQDSITITTATGTPLQVTAGVQNTPICGQGCTGQILATATGGTGALTYSWSIGTVGPTTLFNLCPGTYSVIVTDAIGNAKTASVTLGCQQQSNCSIEVTATETTGGNVDFTATVNPPGSVIYWNFHDGTTFKTTSTTISHTYNTNGAHEVSVEIDDLLSQCSYTHDSTNFYVTTGCGSYTKIDYSWAYDQQQTCQIYDSSAGLYTKIAWANIPLTDSIETFINWGDGVLDQNYIPHNNTTGSIYLNKQHVYGTPGTYTILLKTFANGTCYNDSAIMVVTVGNAICGNLIGTVYNDANNNCSRDGNELGVAGIPIKVTQGTNTYMTWTDALGNYAFNSLPTGTYVIEINGVTPGRSIACSNSKAHNTSVTTTSTSVENFAITCNGNYDLVAANIILNESFFPGDYGHITPVINQFPGCNATGPVAGKVKLVLSPLLHYAGIIAGYSITPSQVITAATGDTIVWNVADLLAVPNPNYSNYYWIYNWIYAVNIQTDVAATIGDSVCISIIVSPLNDADPSNNVYSRCFAVGNSFDPNSKDVSPAGRTAQGLIPQNTPDLTYTIHFQNTGTAAARNVYLLDTLDTDLNLESLEVLNSSHPVHPYLLPNGVVKFMFSNIMLPDSAHNPIGSMGFVTFKINLKSSLAIGTEIKNTAHIFFDYNPAIVTNTTLNTIDLATGIENKSRSITSIKVYPNPSNGLATVTYVLGENSTVNINLYDIVGKKVLAIENGAKTSGKYQTSFNAESLDAGSYLLQMNVDGQISSERFVVTK